MQEKLKVQKKRYNLAYKSVWLISKELNQNSSSLKNLLVSLSIQRILKLQSSALAVSSYAIVFHSWVRLEHQSAQLCKDRSIQVHKYKMWAEQKIEAQYSLPYFANCVFFTKLSKLCFLHRDINVLGYYAHVDGYMQ